VPSARTADAVVTLFALRGPTDRSEKERKGRHVMKRKQEAVEKLEAGRKIELDKARVSGL
jgi:hypothetical protein